MRIDSTRQAAPTSSVDFDSEMTRQNDIADEQATPGRALTVIEPPQPAAPVFRRATFLAHLIATKELAPQTRERRRAEPSEAIAAYRSVSALSVA